MSKHLSGFEDSGGLTASPVLGSRHRPQMFTAAQRGRTVLGGYTEDFLAALGIHAEHGSRAPVRSDDQITDLEVPDRPESRRRQDLTEIGLGPATHECQ